MIIKYNNKVVTHNDKWIGYSGEPVPPPVFTEVQIGNQIWLAVNLNIDDGGEGIVHVDNVVVDNVNIGTQYYYTWDAANRVSQSIQGWHLPTLDEYETLFEYVGGRTIAGLKLKSTSGWLSDGNGTDDYGFTSYPAGRWNGSSVSVPGQRTFLWTSTDYGESNKYYIDLHYNGDNASLYNSSTNYYFSVRLIKDT